MPELMELINRKDEVKSINNLIQKASKHTVVFLCGDGGLGKTRLLQEIRNTYTNKNNKNKFLVANIIDFDDRSLHTFEGLEIKIARELDIEAEVAEEVRELRKVRSEGATQRIIKIQQEKITNILKNQFNELSKTRRVLLFFDTIEKIEESTLRSLLVLLSHFENGVFLFAGRPSLPSPRSQTNIAQLMKNQFGEDSVIDIEPLDQNKSGEYLRAKLGIDNLKDKWIQNLLPLVEGKPILIELAAEWLSTTQPPDWLLTLSDKDLQTKQKDFAANLVRHITQLRTPMDRLLLVLSRVYPFDVQMAEELLGLSKQDAETLIDSAKTYVFVKTLPGAQITLHDEMRKMVDEFVWPFIDKPGERRRRDSKRAVAIFERRLTKLAEDQENKENAVSNIQSEERRRIERIALTEQLVEHGLYADIDPGFEVFTKTWDEAVNNKDYLFAERMLEIAKPFSDQFTEEQDIHYVLFKARQKNYTGYSGVSLQDLRKYEKRYAKEPIFLSPIYNALGIAERKAGSMKDAADYLSNNLKIAKRTNPDSAPKVANQLGYTYRLMGYSKKAESMYKYGLKLAMEAEDRNKDLIASLLNNLGYIYGIQKKYDTAENYCLQAADLWREIGFTSQIGRVYISLGIFARDRGNYEEAIRLFEQAIVQASGSSDFEIIGLAYCHLAWAKWFKWEEMNKTAILDWDETKKKDDFEKDDFVNIALLREAKKDFDDCLTLAEERGLAEQLPAILHQMSNIYWWLGWLEDGQYKLLARELNTRSRKESVQRDNFRYAIDSLVGDAEFDYDAGEYSNIPEYVNELQARYSRMEKEYLLYFGRISRIVGDVAFNRGDYVVALNHYTDAFLEIQRHGGYGRYSTRWELLRLERKLDKLSLSEVNRWLEHFRVHWKKNVELIHWCDKELLRIKLRAN